VLKRAGAGNTPVPGDEIPAGPGSHATVDKRSPSIDGQLRFAIANKHLIQFRYHGDRRVAEPHDYGIHNGSAKLLVYQHSRSGSVTGRSHGAQGWRLLDVAKIVECAVLEATFLGSRGEAHHRHYSWDVIYARVG
jgi:hypothetical protein